MDKLIEKAAKVYEKTGKLGETAEELGVSIQKCRKILISAGAYAPKTERIEHIINMHNKGKSKKEIAESLGISERYVHAVLPYEKCIYNSENQTENAKRREKCGKGKIA